MDRIIRKKQGGICSVCNIPLEQDYKSGRCGLENAGSHCPNCFLLYRLNPEANIPLIDSEVRKVAKGYSVPVRNVCCYCGDVAPADIPGTNKFWSCSCGVKCRVYHSTHTEVP